MADKEKLLFWIIYTRVFSKQTIHPGIHQLKRIFVSKMTKKLSSKFNEQHGELSDTIIPRGRIPLFRFCLYWHPRVTAVNREK